MPLGIAKHAPRIELAKGPSPTPYCRTLPLSLTRRVWIVELAQPHSRSPSSRARTAFERKVITGCRTTSKKSSVSRYASRFG